jgi:hypothetical protein
MSAGGGGIEGKLDVREVRHPKQALDPVCGGGHTHPPRTGQPVGVGVDADHGANREWAVTVQDFDRQVGADVAGAGDGHRPPLCGSHGMSFSPTMRSAVW